MIGILYKKKKEIHNNINTVVFVGAKYLPTPRMVNSIQRTQV